MLEQVVNDICLQFFSQEIKRETSDLFLGAWGVTLPSIFWNYKELGRKVGHAARAGHSVFRKLCLFLTAAGQMAKTPPSHQ